MVTAIYSPDDAKDFNDADTALRTSGVLADLAVARKRLTGTRLDDRRQVKPVFRRLGWDISRKVWPDRDFSYDGYKAGVAVESVRAVDTGAMTAFLRLECGYRLRGIEDAITVGIVFVPLDKGGRTDRPHGKPRFHRVVDLAERLVGLEVLEVPLRILGIQTAYTRTKE